MSTDTSSTDIDIQTMVNTLSTAHTLAKAENERVLSEVGDLNDQVLSINKRLEIEAKLTHAAGQPIAIAQALNNITHYGKDIPSLISLRDKYRAMTNALETMLSDTASINTFSNPDARLECIKMCLHFLTYHQCGKCRKVQMGHGTCCGADMYAPGLPHPQSSNYTCTVNIPRNDWINRSDKVMFAKYDPYWTRKLLEEVSLSTPGPALDLDHPENYPPYYECMRLLAQATQKVESIWLGCGSLIAPFIS